MRAKTFWLLGALAPIVQGCAVFSFAPPRVNMVNVLKDDGRGQWHCKSARSEGTKATGGEIATHKLIIGSDFDGANALIDNFLMSYRCAARDVANGRQYFEMPALAVALGGATAAAFNAPVAVAIATGATVAGLNSTKAYYAPREKTPILAAAVDALTCLKSEAVGLENYGSSVIGKVVEETHPSPSVTKKTTLPSQAPGGENLVPGDTATGEASTSPPTLPATSQGATVAVSASKQYFTLVESALLSVENIAAQRLSSVGGFAPDALIGEITTLSAEVNKKEEERKATEEALKKPTAIPPAADGTPAAAPTPPNADAVAAAATIKADATAVYEAAGPNGTTIPATKVLKYSLIPGSNTKGLINEETLQALADSPKKANSLSEPELKGLAAGEMFVGLKDGKAAVQPLVGEKKKEVEDKAAKEAKVAAISEVLLNIRSLQPKMKLCVVRAKL